jgi:putative transposase
MPRKRERDAPPVVYRTARCGLRVSGAQRNRLFGLLRSAGDVWCAVLELNRWRRSRRDAPLAGYQELCRELAESGPGTFGELDTTGARSVLRRYSDAWFAAAGKRRAGDASARFPRRRRGLVPVRWYAGTFTLDGRALRLPAARGCPPLLVRLDRDVPYPAGQVRSVTLGFDAGRLYLDVTAEVPVAVYPQGTGPGPRPGRGRGPGHHPPLRRRRPRRAAAGLRKGHPRRVPPAPARPQRPHPRRRPPRPQARAARVAPLAAAPAPGAGRRGPAPAAGPAGPARGRQDRRVVGGGAPGRDAGGRRPARRPEPESRAAS